LNFSSILGHERQLEVIRRNLSTGQIPPTYLFYGEEGVGKRLVALALAKALNCSDPTPEGDSCGVCQSCRNINSGCHPNIMMVGLEPNPDTGKMRQAIVIAQVRAAQEFISLKSVGGGRKALIVDGAHLMNEEAMNAFLKTLEEPPAESHIVLVTSRPDSLLPTVLSRCRAVGFSCLSEEALARLLMEKKGLPHEDALIVARLTGGRPGEALGVEPSDLLERRRDVIKFMSKLPDKSLPQVLKAAEKMAADEGVLEDLVVFGSAWFRDIMILSAGAKESLAINRDLTSELRIWVGRIGGWRSEEAISLLGQTGRALERTFNRRLMAEDLFLRLKREVLN
jgi:DNA polymerase-3 subunit delta'